MAETYPPGRPQGIWEIADNLDDRAKVLTSASEQLAALRKIPWHSGAGDAFRAHVTKRCATMDDNAADIARAANILRTFGKFLLDLQREHAELEQKRATLEKEISDAANPPASAESDSTAVASMALTIGKQADIQFRWQEAVEQAAAEIQALDLYPENDSSVAGIAPMFKWPWDDHYPPNRDVNPDILTKDGSFDHWGAKQGGLGSCFLVSSLIGFMRTDAGDQMIKDNIRWDSKKQGYWVTLYHNGQPEEYFVDQVFDDCALENDDFSFLWVQSQRPGVPALYEAVFYQATGKRFVDEGGELGRCNGTDHW